MFSLKQQLNARKTRSSGFTIVELLIVIVVIGILATLVIVTFTGIQQKGRNSQRQTDINAVQSHVEAFYADKGYYPTIQQLSDTTTWVPANLKGLDPEALKDPKGATVTGAPSTTTSFAYGYVATHDDGVACTSGSSGTADDASCTKYVLTAAQEGSGAAIYTKSSN
jgi:prepilin-type N-terminal cleavage/methylation domain-containing protein